MVGSKNGCFPVDKKWIKHPADHISHLELYGCDFKISGAEKPAVPLS